MSDIANLEQAVEAARAAYARASEQQGRSRRHAMSLIGIVETELRETRVALAQNEVERTRMTREYGQLREMLHALVMTVEAGGADRLWSGPDAETRAGPLAVVGAPSDTETLGNGEDEPDDVRAGLQRVLKKASKAKNPKDTAPAE